MICFITKTTAFNRIASLHLVFLAAEQLFREAINDVLMDDLFKLTSYNAKMAMETTL